MIWLVFGRTVHHEFVNFDDDVYVYKNPNVTGGLSSKSVAWAFTQVHSSNWHPLTWLSHMLDCQLYQLNPAGHHLTNVLLHTATTILLFLVLRQLLSFRPATASSTNRRSSGNIESALPPDAALWCSAFVAAMFAIHPLRVESVAWVAERKDVLSGLFFMLTIFAYAKYVSGAKCQVSGEGEASNSKQRTPNSENPVSRFPFPVSRWYWLCLIFFTLALMSKPMVVTLPFVLLLLDYWPLKRVSGARCQVSGKPAQGSHLTLLIRLLAEKIPLLALSGAACAVTFLSQQQAMSSLPLSLRIENALVSSVVYLKQLFYPSGLAVLYPYPVSGLSPWKIVGATVLLLTVTTVAAAGWRRKPWLLVGWLWYLGMLVPVIGILQVGAQAQADRYTYLPQIGLALLLTWTVLDLTAGWRHRGLMLGGLATAIVAALVFCARTQTACWRNSESLWTHTLACTSDNFVADDNLGNALFEEGRLNEAIRHFHEALRIKPDHAEAHYNLANALVRKGQTDDAIGHYQQALQLKPDDAKSHYNLGVAFLQKGNVDDAITQFEATLRLKPDDTIVRNNLANAFFQKGDVDRAISEFQHVLQLKPDDAKAHYNLGMALLQKGDADQAIARLRKALQLQPDDVVVRNNLGNILFQQGDVDEAIAQFQKVLQLKPDDAKAHFNLGNALLKQGSVDEAISHFQKSLEIKSDGAEAEFCLGSALLQKGSESEAILHFQRALQINPDYSEARNDLAWELATSPQAALRNGPQAVELAERANQLADGKDVDILDTLAAAYAEAGRFEDAARTARKAIELAQAAGQSDQLSRLNSELKLYEARRPFHRETK
jgi:Flp pilus assembly protein TadD